MPIDYSKWDHLDEYSDEDDFNDCASNTTPRVTRLDAPSQVTFGGGSMTTKIKPSTSTEKEIKNTVEDTTSITNALSSSTNSQSAASTNKKCDENKSSPQNQLEKDWTIRGGFVITDDQRKLYWTQDRYSITLRLELHEKEKISVVDTDGFLQYTDRFAATGTTKPEIRCKDSHGKTVLEGELPHPVHLEEEDDEVGWTIVQETMGRFFVIILYKAVPMQGVFLWWRRPLMQFPEVDVNQDDTGRTTASQEFLNAWEEAHKIFKEKKQNEKKPTNSG